jgi:hypothetical protein
MSKYIKKEEYEKLMREHKTPSTLPRPKCNDEETRKFNDRLRWYCKFWYNETRSLIPSTWPALEEELKKWGCPGLIRR